MPISANTVVGTLDISHNVDGSAFPPGEVSPYNRVTFQLFGNGTASAVSFDLTKAPFNLVFNGNPPSVALVSGTSGDNPTPMTATMSGSSVIMSFTPTIPSQVAVSLRWLYQAS